MLKVIVIVRETSMSVVLVCGLGSVVGPALSWVGFGQSVGKLGQRKWSRGQLGRASGT